MSTALIAKFKTDKLQRRHAFLKLLLTTSVFASAGLAGSTAIAAGSSEGINVHGDWKITLLNEQGHAEKEILFSNDLTDVAKRQLTMLLTNQVSMFEKPDGTGLWAILVSISGGEDTTECKSLYSHLILASGLPTEAAVTYTDETFTLKRVLTLPASCITGATYSITSVSSNATTLADGDTYLGSFAFSGTQLPTPVVVNPDQPVLLEVTFSFE